MKRNLNLEQTPTFPNGITDPTATDHTATSLFREKGEVAFGSTPLLLSKLSREDNPPFIVYLTKAQKLMYAVDRIDDKIRKMLHQFTDSEKPTIYLTMLFVNKDECPHCNFSIDPPFSKLLIFAPALSLFAHYLLTSILVRGSQ